MAIENLKELIQKVNQLKKENPLDLSKDEDLSLAVMNLVSIEEHFFFTAVKTKKEKYFDLLNQVRHLRKELLKKLIRQEEGEWWCLAKHLLAASMRLMEVGTKCLGEGQKEEADQFFQKAYQLYSLFWGVNLGLISLKDVQKIDEEALNKHDLKREGLFQKLGDLLAKIIDCCKE